MAVCDPCATAAALNTSLQIFVGNSLYIRL